MPSRNSAAIAIVYDPEQKPFHLHLTGSGAPWAVKELMRAAFRGRRAAIMSDPEMFVVWFFRYACAKTRVNITQREERYVWWYKIDLLPQVPTIRIGSASGDERHKLFRWIGPERFKLEEKVPKAKLVEVRSGKRGRPSTLAKLGYVPAPEYIDEHGVAHFKDETPADDSEN